MGRRATLIVALLALAVPAAAAGQATTVPPGNSEADQYFETVPGPKGDRSIDGSKSPGDVLTPKQRASLEALGAEGTATAELAAGTAPGVGRAAAGSSSASATVAEAAADREGMGSWLWVILAASAIGALAFGAVRWRARRG